MERLLGCFVNAKANSFENLLDPFLKICRLSSNIVSAISSTHPFFQKLADRLGHPKAVVRLNLLRLLRILCETSPDRTIIVERYGFYSIVKRLREKDNAVLVKEMAGDLIPILAPGSPVDSNPKSNPGNASFSRPAVLRRKIPRRSTSEASGTDITGSFTLQPSKTRQLKPKGADLSRR